VVCTEVLEHVADLNGAVAELARIVRQNGYVAISSPNYLNPMGVRKWWKDRSWAIRIGIPGWSSGIRTPDVTGDVRSAVAPLLTTEATLGAGYLMGWIPLGFRRIARSTMNIHCVGSAGCHYFATWEWAFSSPSQKGATMIVTVVVPTYNRSQALDRCLRALNAQTLDRAVSKRSSWMMARLTKPRKCCSAGTTNGLRCAASTKRMAVLLQPQSRHFGIHRINHCIH